MKILILAAGYGTRLYPHTKNFPKPLLKIGKRPIINFILEKIEELRDISQIIVVTNDRFFGKFMKWKDSIQTSHPISILNDLTTSPEDKLGAIGDMHFVFEKENFDDDFLVLGGDNLFKGSLLDFVYYAQSQSNYVTVGLFDIKDKQEARHYGVVSVDKDNRIIEFLEKPSEPKSTLVAMCLYYFPRQTLPLINDYLNNPLNSRDTAGSYIDWLSTQGKACGFIFREFWVDIGHIHTYKKVEQDLREGH